MKLIGLIFSFIFIASLSYYLVHALNDDKVSLYEEEFGVDEIIIIPKGYYIRSSVMDFIEFPKQEEKFILPKYILHARRIDQDESKNSDYKKIHEDLVVSLTRNCVRYRAATLDIIGDSYIYCIVNLTDEKVWINRDLIGILKFRQNRNDE